MLHGNFNWFYCQKSLDYDKKMQPMFQHIFLSDDVKSYKFDLINNLLEKIIKKRKVNKFLRVKSNLYLKNNKQQSHTKHTDIKNFKNYETAIYYLTTTNGSTTIGDKKKLKIKKIELFFLMVKQNIMLIYKLIKLKG